MYRKFALIFALAGAFAGLLITQPWKNRKGPHPRIFDRLPEAEIIGKSSVLDLARSMGPTLYNYKIPYREFLTHEFILSQGKNFGVDVQSPLFFFANEDGFEIEDIGGLFIISDTAKLFNGVAKIKQLMTIKDSVYNGKHVYINEANDFYLTYDKNWLLVYYGKNFDEVYTRVRYAKRNEISSKWRQFLNLTLKDSTSTVAFASFPEMKKFGWDHADFTVKNDSSSLWFETKLTYQDTLPFQLKKGGYAYAEREFTKHLVNLNLDVTRLTQESADPTYVYLKQLSKKAHFPFDEFMQSWKGNLSFRQGGLEEIKEKVVVSELDENFNITETVKYQTVKIPGYAVYMNSNQYVSVLLTNLFQKGFLTKDQDKYRIVFSPPANMNASDSSLVLYTSKYLPNMEPLEQNCISFTHDYYYYRVMLDSTDTYTLSGRFYIPVERLVRKKINPNT